MTKCRINIHKKDIWKKSGESASKKKFHLFFLETRNFVNNKIIFGKETFEEEGDIYLYVY